jgi:glycosyltransferase involved in cell wall biosynthesis
MSKFGETLYPGAPVIPHGVDPFFRPVTPKEPIITSTGVKVTSKRDAKKVFGFTGDEILVLRVDRNSHRKDFGASWKALIPVMRRNPQVHAWFHCRFDGDQLELSQVLSREPALADRFHFPDRFRTQRGWADVDLLTLYNAADIFLSTSWGEGFGLTLGEAAAVGLPIVAQNVSAIPEVVGPGGILLEPERRITVGSGQDQWLPNVDSFSEAIERLVESRGARRELGEAGRRHVTASFSWDDSARRFHELITATISEAERQSSGGPSGSSTARS